MLMSMNPRTASCIPLICALSTPIYGEARLPESVKKELDHYKIPMSAVSLEINRLSSPDTIVSVNADTPRNPASVMKLVTTLAALELLGPAYTWKTEYYTDGRLRNGRLDGNLILRGGGDPYLVSDQFRHQLHLLKQKGLSEIVGDLIIDNSAMTVPNLNRAQFDGRPQRVYNVVPSASIVNFSATRVILQPDNNKIRIITEPPVPNLYIKNQLAPVNARCRNRWAGWSFKAEQANHQSILNFDGKYPIRCGSTEFTRAFLPNTEYTYGLFKSIWEEMGGQLHGQFGLGPVNPRAQRLLAAQSKPLAEIIRGVNKFSNNIMARQLLLTIGKEQYGVPGTTQTGIYGIKEWLHSNGLAMPELVMENGAGLSRISRISAQSLSGLLRKGWDSNYRPEFLSSLALASIDGTMRRRLRKEAPAGRVRIKTGSLNGTRAIAGYVRSNSGQDYSVVMLLNHDRVSYRSGSRVQDALLRWVLRL